MAENKLSYEEKAMKLLPKIEPKLPEDMYKQYVEKLGTGGITAYQYGEINGARDTLIQVVNIVASLLRQLEEQNN